MVPSTAIMTTSSPSHITTKLRTLKRTLDKATIFNSIPALHSLILLLEMATLAMIVRRYDVYFDKRPVLTMMVTNSVLNGIADTVAQTVTTIRRNHAPAADQLGIELDNKLPSHSKHPPTSHPRLPPTTGFDTERLLRFASWGFIIAPFQFRWLQFLQRSFPLSSSSATIPAIQRMVTDQTVFAPAGLLGFFTYMTYAQGGDTMGVRNRIGEMFLPTLRANYALWPAVQLLNFRVVPLRFQLPFASAVGILWGTYLSMASSGGK